jgi:SEC-C motif domain protein
MLGHVKLQMKTCSYGNKKLPPSRLTIFNAGMGFGTNARKTTTPKKTCNCGSPLIYTDCCSKLIDANQLPSTAEQLMRSRFTAYARGNWKYILETTHPDELASSPTYAEDVVATADKVSYQTLKVLTTEDGSTPNEAFVTFKVGFKVRKQLGQRSQGFHMQSMTEHSRFLKDEVTGRWLYREAVSTK